MTSLRIAVLGLAAASLVAGCDGARPIDSAGSGQCATCHGAPPPPFVTTTSGGTHPQSDNCTLCHASTVSPTGEILAAHRNGTVEVTIHAVPFTNHPEVAFADLAACGTCHGPQLDGGVSGVSCDACHADAATFPGGLSFPDWQTNCTFCHGTRTQGFTGAQPRLAAPPQGVRGETLATQPQVGAHQKHLAGGTLSDGVGCSECHAVPGDLSHVSGGPAAIAFGGLASQGSLSPQYTGGSCAATYCHGGQASTSPAWTGTIACGDCHGSPPATGQHELTFHSGFPCARCHVQVAGATGAPTILDSAAARGLHVNGTKNVAFSVSGTWDSTAKTCTNVACHGGTGTKSW